MAITVDVAIQASKEAVWRVITDIENSPHAISGIESVDILEKPSEGLVGLKWRETRTLFGKTATEVLWITEAKPHEMYRTRAESHGAVYVTTLTIAEANGTTRLAMEFDSTPQSLSAKFMAAVTGVFFRNATKKALMQDLFDIKKAAEG